MRGMAGNAQPVAAEYVALAVGAGMVYLIAVWRCRRRPASIRFRYVLLVGVACRLLLLSTPPLFDDDIHRYLWDGKVLNHGYNPFSAPPLAPALAALRDANWEQVNYPQVRTIYPPLAQGIFGLAYFFGLHTASGLKGMILVFDMANILLIAALLTLLRLPRSWTIAYAWSPLAMKEFANSGHIEPVMLCFLLLALYLLLRARPRWAGVSFAAAVLTKLIPLMLLPLCWRLGRWKTVAAAGVAVILLYLPFIGAGGALFSGALTYARYWTFNGSIFALLNAAQSALFAGTAQLPFNPLRLLVLMLIGGYAVAAARNVAVTDRLGIMVYTRNVLALYLLLMPTVDPWYVCWLLPFLCFKPSWGLLLLTVTCNLSYLYYSHGTFPLWIPLVEYTPVYLLLLGEWWVARRRSSEQHIDTALTLGSG